MSASKDALKGNDIATIKSTKEALMTASHKLAEAVYKASQGQSSQEGAQGASQPSDQRADQSGQSAQDNVVDAEVIDDKK